jgi:hypothetical protein
MPDGVNGVGLVHRLEYSTRTILEKPKETGDNRNKGKSNGKSG